MRVRYTIIVKTRNVRFAGNFENTISKTFRILWKEEIGKNMKSAII